MNENSVDTLARFLREKTLLALVLVATICLLLILFGIGVSKKFLSEGIISSFIETAVVAVSASVLASCMFAVLTRSLFERDAEVLFERSLAKLIESKINEQTKDVVKHVKLKIAALHRFMPSEPYVNRVQANDAVEKMARELISSGNTYSSFGLSGKYAVARYLELDVKNSKLELFVVHPKYIKLPLIYDPDKTRTELLGSLIHLARRVEKKPQYQMSIFFVIPIPSLRIDMTDEKSMIYLYADNHESQKRLPDVGLFERDSYWFNIGRSIIEEIRSQCEDKIIIHELFNNDNFMRAFERKLVEVGFNRGEFDAAAEKFSSQFHVPFGKHARTRP